MSVDENFPLFTRRRHTTNSIAAPPPPRQQQQQQQRELTAVTEPDSNSTTFAGLGLAEWAVETCNALGMNNPTPVQQHCIPRILAGRDVLGIAHTGTGKTAAFALPILHRLSENPYGVYALVVTPTRELAHQLKDQFRALGSSLGLRCAVVIGGMNDLTQSQDLLQRPHVVIATPGRIKTLIQRDPDLARVFSKTKFLVLDEADRVLDAGFAEELEVIFRCLPNNRQTLLFSATNTSVLQTLLQVSASNKPYVYQAYQGNSTVGSLKSKYIFKPIRLKEVYLHYVLSRMNDMGIRSTMIFVSTCQKCHFLASMLEALELEAAALHSLKSQSLRLAALQRFKSGKVSVLLATDVASRGLDIPTVDLVINYDIPRDPADYVHRVGRTARAGREGLAISLLAENDVDLVEEIESDLQIKLEEFECKENEVNEDIMKVFKAKRVATMKMMDDGFEQKAKARKELNLKRLADKGLMKDRNEKRKRFKSRK